MNGLFDDIRIMLYGMWRHRWLALAVAWGICLACWLIISLIPNRYQSEARIMVQMQSILPDKIGITPVERQRDIDHVRQTLVSAVNLEKVVRGTDLKLTVASDRDVAERVAMLQQNIKIVAQQDNLFQITATMAVGGLSDADNAKLSAAVVQKLIDIFVAENLAGNKQETEQTLVFLDEQLAQRERELHEAEQKRLHFDQSFAGGLPGMGSVSERMDMARSELAQIESNLISAQSALTAVTGQMAGTAPSVATPGFAGTMGGSASNRLATIEGQLAEARARGWTDAHPDVIALHGQLKGARSAAAGELRSGSGGSLNSPNPLYISLRAMQAERQATVAALSARKNQLQGDVNRLLARQSADPGAMSEHARTGRDHQVLKQQYDKLLADREDIRLRSEVQTGTNTISFKVIDPPTRPRIPIAPNRPLLLAAVLMVGLGGGAAAAFAKSQLRSTFSTPQRLEKASGLPVIGSIREIVTGPQKIDRRKKLMVFAGGTCGLAVALGILLAVEFVQRSMVA